MTGLLKKDLYMIKNMYGKSYLILMLLVIGLLIFTTGNDTSFISAWLIILFTMMSVTAINYDDKCGWNAYALTMPVSRKALAGSKYLLALLLDSAAAVLSLLLSLVSSFQGGSVSLSDRLPSILIGLVLGLVILSILIPVNFKFGAEKGRIALFAAAFLPAGFLLLVEKTRLALYPPFKAAADGGIAFLERYRTLLPWAAAILLVLVVFLSYRVSVGILKKKEF